MIRGAYKKSKLVYGWGINDSDYVTQTYVLVDGKRKRLWVCPIYEKWRAMIKRCFFKSYKINKPSYDGIIICDEWKYFSNFRKWVLEEQPNKDWENCDLDKDLLDLDVTKEYSPATCSFITKKVNCFIKDSKSSKSSLMIGAVPMVGSKNNPFQSYVSNPLNKKTEFIGAFPTELEAHLAWKARKHEIACIFAEQQTDPRVADALRKRYAPDTDWTNR